MCLRYACNVILVACMYFTAHKLRLPTTVPLDLNFTYARAQKLLHLTFIAMLPSSSLVLPSNLLSLLSNSLVLPSSSLALASFSSARIATARELLVTSNLLHSLRETCEQHQFCCVQIACELTSILFVN